METCINYTDELAYVSSDERRWIFRIRKLAQERPGEVQILANPEDNDGCIYATVPARWIQARPPVKMNLTEEERQKRSEMALMLRRKQLGRDDDADDGTGTQTDE